MLVKMLFWLGYLAGGVLAIHWVANRLLDKPKKKTPVI